MCKAWTQRFWMGTLNGSCLLGEACGYVLSQETLDNMSGELDLRGFGCMEWESGSIEFFVLGVVGGSGTAIVLDAKGNVWLYNHPDAIDRPHEECTWFQAAMFLPDGKTAVKDEEIVLTHVLKHVKVTMHEEEFDED